MRRRRPRLGYAYEGCGLGSGLPIWLGKALRQRGVMKIGDNVTYEGRTYILCGIDPMGADDRRAELEDLETGEHLWVPFDAVAEV